MSGEGVKCTICNSDIPRANFLQHFRECSAQQRARQAANAPTASATPAAAPAPVLNQAAAPAASVTSAATPVRPAPTAPPVQKIKPQELDYGDDLAANMGMDASCLPDDYSAQNNFRAFYGAFDDGPARSRAKPKKKKPLEEMFVGVDPSMLDYEQRRKYKFWKVKMDWEQRHMQDPPIQETGLEYLDLSDEDRPNLEACRFCRFYFAPERIERHERRCVKKPRPEHFEDTFDIAAPVAELRDDQRRRLQRRAALESHERIPRALDDLPPGENPLPGMRGLGPQPGRKAVESHRERLRLAAMQPVHPAEHEEEIEEVAVKERGPKTLEDILTMVPDNPYWLETVPITIEAVRDASRLVDEVRTSKKKSDDRPEWVGASQFNMADRLSQGTQLRRLQHRRSSPSTKQTEAEDPALEEHLYTRRAVLKTIKSTLENIEADAPPQLPATVESPELLEMESWRRAVLRGNAWGDCYYPYSDKYLLTDNIYHRANQRQSAVEGARAAVLYNMSADRRAVIQQVYDDVHWKRMRACNEKAAERQQVVAEAEWARRHYGPLDFFF